MGIWEVRKEPPVFMCNQCREEYFSDRLLPERQRRADNSLTRPIGDPGEAMHGGTPDVA